MDNSHQGRFPANVIFDEHAGEMLDEQSGYSESSDTPRNNNFNGINIIKLGLKPIIGTTVYTDKGGASRYFKCISGDYETIIEKQDIKPKKEELCGKILENQRVDGMSVGEIKVVESYIRNAEQFMCGNSTMEFVKKDTTSIILILIKQMMTLQTYNYLQKKNTIFYTKDYESIIKLLMELHSENVKNVENIKQLIISILEKMGHIKDFVKNVLNQNCNYGEIEIENTTTSITENTEKNISRFRYCPKVSAKERNLGLDDFEEKIIQGRDEGQDGRSVPYKTRPTPIKNGHPTVKPINLLAYLIKLISPPNAVILDAYMGSGSTGIAARLLGFDFIGMEMDEDYFKIAEARIENYEMYRELLKNK
jgi:hypothetical protein